MTLKNRNELIDSTHFPYMLIRDFLLSNILGDDMEDILYWSGKELAREFPLTEKEDIIASFSHCGFGDLEKIKQEKNKHSFILKGDLVATRLLNESATFQLEAGFLAEQITRITGNSCEVQVEIKSKLEVGLVVCFD